MAHFACRLLKTLTDLIKIMHRSTEKVIWGRCMGLQKGRSIRAERDTTPKGSSHRGIRATCLHTSLPLLILTGMIRTLSLQLCNTPTVPSPSPVLGGRETKARTGSGSWKPLSFGAKSKQQKQLALFPCFLKDRES